MLENASSSPDLVAKMVLQTVTSENPGLRYLAGKDVGVWAGIDKSCKEILFYKVFFTNDI